MNTIPQKLCRIGIASIAFITIRSKRNAAKKDVLFLGNKMPFYTKEVVSLFIKHADSAAFLRPSPCIAP
jgi:hypothetical protein